MSWIVWVIIALLFGLVLIVSVDFAFVMFAGGALVAAIVAAFTDNTVAQIVVFCAVSTILVFTVRPWANRKMASTAPNRRMNTEALVSRQAEAITDVTNRAGRVKLSGEVWSARTDGGVIPQGAEVRVVRIEGATAIVIPN